MKQISKIGFFLVIVFTVTIFAQQAETTGTPPNVIKAFQTAHPKAQEVTWDKEGVNYEANYKEDSNKYSVVINDAGEILETEKEIDISELPGGVVKYINDNYDGYSISGAAKITDNKGNVKYEAEIKNGGTSKDVIFDQSGKPISHEKESGEKEDEDND